MAEEEKTEEPTQHKLKKAREKGQVAKSKELSTAAVLIATAGVLMASGEYIRSTMLAVLWVGFGAASGDINVAPPRVLALAMQLGMQSSLPVILVAVSAGALAQYLQVGPLFSAKAIEPDWQRLNIVKGFKNLFTRRQVVELAKSIFKLVVVGWVAWVAIKDSLREIVSLATRPNVDAALAIAAILLVNLFFRVGIAIAILAVLDVIYQQWQYKKDQRMTKHEVKREYKDQEGDPHMKQARKRAHQQAVEHATTEQVRKADVLVVNPTHYAVALSYDDDSEDAPEVIAKGQDGLAKRMIDVAKEEGVPVMRDVPLAQSLYELEIGDEIPEELFEAVATILHAAWEERQANNPDPEEGEEGEEEEEPESPDDHYDED